MSQVSYTPAVQPPERGSGLALTGLYKSLMRVLQSHAAAINGLYEGQDPVQLPSYTVATVPAQQTGAMIYVTDETGGAVPAFSDGTDWRRVTDRAVVS